MKKLLVLAVGIGLLLASDALSAAAFTNCRGTSITPPRIDQVGEKACYEVTDTTDSGLFTVTTSTALFCLDPNTATESTTTADAAVMPRLCHAGGTPSVNTCFAMLDVALSGLTGADGTQNACIRVGPGDYYFEITANTKSAKISMMGE